MNKYPIKDYKGLYSVTKCGKIWSHYTNSFLNCKSKNGYQRVYLYKGSKKTRKAKLVHRLVAETLIPNNKNKKYVNHKNGIKSDNRVKNLEWVTFKENMQHAAKNGLCKPPVEGKCVFTKLSREQVLEIRELYKTGKFRQKDLAKIFNVKPTCISKIIRRQRWKHL